MANTSITIIKTYCVDCGESMGEQTDEVAEDGTWKAPIVGGQIETDVIARVQEIFPSKSYVVSLKTFQVPHCLPARKRIASEKRAFENDDGEV